MIDWLNLAFNALWILGLAVALAALSFASWEAWMFQETFAARLRQPAIQTAFSLAGLLFCLGLAGTAGAAWKTGLWLVLAAAFLLLGLSSKIKN